MIWAYINARMAKDATMTLYNISARMTWDALHMSARTALRDVAFKNAFQVLMYSKEYISPFLFINHPIIRRYIFSISYWQRR
jgi:hypothetical protein